MKKRVVSLIITLSLISAPAYVVSYEGGEPDRSEKSTAIIWDALAVRPISFIAMVAGAILFVPVAILTSMGGNDIESVQDTLIKEPWDYTMNRPWGQFD